MQDITNTAAAFSRPPQQPVKSSMHSCWPECVAGQGRGTMNHARWDAPSDDSQGASFYIVYLLMSSLLLWSSDDPN